ncbi:winged helix-turn-helix transcriptional regulator [Streptomyces verrucosisporus]|uniref:MarR family winged helix-turn-helix transcriptional regulator n=1 Tax=Streptomyces verrucosisporus TaxID=1695161 RepID=UPI0019CF524E|nr:MarR family winged helix-turn-helix transcriptional regulator [Streptomyces verrucosisporus]MBN3929407.1 winged helix-turn-helix transcriptional regulator [Streptomyces verrucosisporus]
MTAHTPYEDLARELGSVGTVRRELARNLPHDCPPAPAVVLTLLGRHGEMRMTRLADLMAIDMSVTSRHVAYAVERGWVDRRPDPLDGRVRLLRLTGSGQEMLAEMHRRTSETLAHLLGDWPQEDVARLTELLAGLRASFGDCGCGCRTAPRGARPLPPDRAAAAQD